ncbi:MAG: division/cell wall cluster transcriptional repressor MraZ [Fibrobacteres bacterium]|nr:division/cell wall cluster transcriptional repressor MraZ [Fibrobacterota bacterium]
MSMLFSSFENISIDDKGRFSIPASLRAALSPEADSSFMIVRGTEGCLFAYPKDEWIKFFRALRRLPVTAENTRLRRRITGSLKETKVDGQGRVTLTADLKTLAGIGNEIVIVGDGEKLELWNADTWRARKAKDEESATYETDFYRAMGEIGGLADGE